MIADSSVQQPLPGGSWKAQSNLAIVLAQGLARKLASHFRTNDITALSNARTEMDVDTLGLEFRASAQASERGLDDSVCHATPPGVRRRDGAIRREQNGETIGTGDGEHEPGGACPDAVTLGHSAGTGDLDRACAVDLRWRRQGEGTEPQRFEETAAVLGDGLGPVLGRASEIQRVVRRVADSAAAGREGDTGMRRLGVEAPGWHGRTSIQRPHGRAT